MSVECRHRSMGKGGLCTNKLFIRTTWHVDVNHRSNFISQLYLRMHHFTSTIFILPPPPPLHGSQAQKTQEQTPSFLKSWIQPNWNVKTKTPWYNLFANYLQCMDWPISHEKNSYSFLNVFYSVNNMRGMRHLLFYGITIVFKNRFYSSFLISIEPLRTDIINTIMKMNIVSNSQFY